MYSDGNGYYATTDEGIALFNQLSQLRIYGEDQFKKTTDRYPWLIDHLYDLFERELLSASTAEACESNKRSIIDMVDKSIRLYATTDYED